MAREFEDYRDNLERLIARFGDVGTISIPQAAQFLGVSDDAVRDTNSIPKVRLGKRCVIPTTGLARFLSKY